MYSRKRAGPRTDPCGTPDVTGTLSEEVPSRTTICDLLLRKASIHSTVNISTWWVLSLWISLLWFTLSNALAKSRMMMSALQVQYGVKAERKPQLRHFALRFIHSHRPLSRRLDRCDRVIQNESRDPFGGNVYYVTMQITFLRHKFRNGERNLHCDIVHITTKWVSSLTLDCNGDFAIKAYSGATRIFRPKHQLVYFRFGAKMTDASSKIDVRRLKVGDLLIQMFVLCASLDLVFIVPGRSWSASQ